MNRPGFLIALLLFVPVAGCNTPGQVTPADTGAAPSGGAGGIEMEGMFRYMADAALFRDCRDNRTYPVSMEGKYIELEHAYLNSGIKPGSEILVELDGRLIERPSMESNSSKINLIVDKFNKLLIDETCAPGVHAELIGTYWKLVEVDGKVVSTPENMKEAHMILASGESRVRGNAGCNNFFGQFEAEGDGLVFSGVGSTMMACEQTMGTEHGFLAALSAATRYQISGLFLNLYAGEQLLARFEAIYL